MARAAAELFGAATGALVEAAVEELKLLLVAGGFGHEFFRMYFPPGVTVSTPAVSGHLPIKAFVTITVVGSNCGRPSCGTEIFIVLSLSPTSRKRGGSWLGR